MSELPFGLSLFQIVLAFAILTVMYFSTMIYILSSHKTSMKEKIGWLALVIFLPILGLVLYWLIQIVKGISK
jgi:hypothetical protein